jgi:hypothetical protein
LVEHLIDIPSQFGVVHAWHAHPRGLQVSKGRASLLDGDKSGDRSTLSGYGDGLTRCHRIDDISAVVAQIANAHLSHIDIVS